MLDDRPLIPERLALYSENAPRILIDEKDAGRFGGGIPLARTDIDIDGASRANALAAEIVKRWNAHAALFSSVESALEHNGGPIAGEGDDPDPENEHWSYVMVRRVDFDAMTAAYKAAGGRS